MNELTKALSESAPEGMFDSDMVSVSYKTGIPVFDYGIGYWVQVYEQENIIDEYVNLGIEAGKQMTIIGKPSTGKTTLAIQIAASVVRNFPSGFVVHFDLERAQNYTRIKNVTGFTSHQIFNDKKYIIKDKNPTLSFMKETIFNIYREKISNPKKYKYDTGKRNEFNQPIIAFQPTVIIIDSIPSITTEYNMNDKKERVKLEEVSSQTDRARLTGEIGRFYTEILQYQTSANIILISINQIRPKVSMSIMPSAADMNYLDNDESMPGGKAPQYYANTLIKMITIGAEKYTVEDDGFNGFGSWAKIIKSRTSSNGKRIHMIYDTATGFDPLRISFEYAKDKGLIGGNKNGYYFTNLENGKEHKFTRVNMNEDFKNDPELYPMLYSQIVPLLKEEVPKPRPIDSCVLDTAYDYD